MRRSRMLVWILGAVVSWLAQGDDSHETTTKSRTEKSKEPTTCVSKNVDDTLSVLFPDKKTKKKVGDAVRALSLKAAGTIQDEVSQLKELAGDKVPQWILMAVISAPEMALDEELSTTLAESASPREAKASTLDELLQKLQLDKDAPFLTKADWAEMLYLALDASAAEEDSVIKAKLGVLFKKARERKLPLNVVKVLLERPEIPSRVRGRVLEMANEELEKDSRVNLKKALSDKAGAFGAKLAAHFEDNEGEQFIRDFRAYQKNNLGIMRGKEELIGDNSAGSTSSFTSSIVGRMDKFARKRGFSYLLPDLMTRLTSDTPLFCPVSGGYADEKKRLAQAEMGLTAARELQDKIGPKYAPEVFAAIQKPLRAIQTEKEGSRPFKEAVRQLQTDLKGATSAADVLDVVKNAPGLQIPPGTLKKVESALSRTAQYSSPSAGGVDITGLTPASQTDFQTKLDKLKKIDPVGKSEEAKKLIRDVFSLAKEGKMNGEKLKQLKAYLTSDRFNINSDTRKLIDHELGKLISVQTLPPELKAEFDKFNRTDLDYLSGAGEPTRTWLDSAKLFAETVSKDPKALATVKHLLDNGYFPDPRDKALMTMLAVNASTQAQNPPEGDAGPGPEKGSAKAESEDKAPPAESKTSKAPTPPAKRDLSSAKGDEDAESGPPPSKTSSKGPTPRGGWSANDKKANDSSEPAKSKEMHSEDAGPAPDQMEKDPHLLLAEESILSCTGCHAREGSGRLKFTPEQDGEFSPESLRAQVKRMLNQLGPAAAKAKLKQMMGKDYGGLGLEEQQALENYLSNGATASNKAPKGPMTVLDEELVPNSLQDLLRPALEALGERASVVRSKSEREATKREVAFISGLMDELNHNGLAKSSPSSALRMMLNGLPPDSPLRDRFRVYLAHAKQESEDPDRTAILTELLKLPQLRSEEKEEPARSEAIKALRAGAVDGSDGGDQMKLVGVPLDENKKAIMPAFEIVSFRPQGARAPGYFLTDKDGKVNPNAPIQFNEVFRGDFIGLGRNQTCYLRAGEGNKTELKCSGGTGHHYGPTPLAERFAKAAEARDNEGLPTTIRNTRQEESEYVEEVVAEIGYQPGTFDTSTGQPGNPRYAAALANEFSVVDEEMEKGVAWVQRKVGNDLELKKYRIVDPRSVIKDPKVQIGEKDGKGKHFYADGGNLPSWILEDENKQRYLLVDQPDGPAKIQSLDRILASSKSNSPEVANIIAKYGKETGRGGTYAAALGSVEGDEEFEVQLPKRPGVLKGVAKGLPKEEDTKNMSSKNSSKNAPSKNASSKNSTSKTSTAKGGTPRSPASTSKDTKGPAASFFLGRTKGKSTDDDFEEETLDGDEEDDEEESLSSSMNRKGGKGASGLFSGALSGAESEDKAGSLLFGPSKVKMKSKAKNDDAEEETEEPEEESEKTAKEETKKAVPKAAPQPRRGGFFRRR